MGSPQKLTSKPQKEPATVTTLPNTAAMSSAVPVSSGSEMPTNHLQSPDKTKEPELKPQPSNPRLAALYNKRSNLESTLASLGTQRSALVADSKLSSGLKMPETWSEEEKTKSALTTANAVIKEHIALLHRYNEIKDIGQGLMGLIADKRGVRIKEVMEEFGVGEKD